MISSSMVRSAALAGATGAGLVTGVAFGTQIMGGRTRNANQSFLAAGVVAAAGAAALAFGPTSLKVIGAGAAAFGVATLGPYALWSAATFLSGLGD